MQYTSELKRLVLPEYGRNVQQMVDHCMTIEDRAERTRCANTIINIMGNLFPHLRDIEDFKHKLWDHLAIMSDLSWISIIRMKSSKKKIFIPCPSRFLIRLLP